MHSGAGTDPFACAATFCHRKDVVHGMLICFVVWKQNHFQRGEPAALSNCIGHILRILYLFYRSVKDIRVPR